MLLLKFYLFIYFFYYINFDNDTMWFMSFGSDIHVFICMGFVLIELFDEWVYSFYNGGYLSGEDFGVLTF